MSRLPIPGGDDNTWGSILNDYLSQSLNADGSLKTSSVSASGAELTSNKGAAGGYASLNGSTQVPVAQLGSGTANTTTYLRGDGTWEVPPSSGGSSTLAGDTDVSITSPSGGQVLTYNAGSSLWNNQALPTAPVTSVAGRTGAITLGESDITNLSSDLTGKVTKAGDTMTGKLVVPSFQVTGGSPSTGKVLTADSSGNAAWQPSTPGTVVALGNVSGTVSCDLSAGVAFTCTLTGDTTFQFTNWPAGLVEPEIYTVQDSGGGHAISVTGVTWEPVGSPPTFSTAPNAVNIIPVVSFNGGTNTYGLTGLQGPAGPTGPTGATGLSGATSPESYLGWVLPASIESPRINASGAIGVAFKAFFYRVVIPKAGTLHDVTVFNGATIAGNHNVAVYDTGDASAGHYTTLWSSGSVAASGSVSSWQVVGDPGLTVTAGQQLLLAVMNDSTTHIFGQGPAYTNTANAQLPPNFIPTTGGALPKLAGTFTFGSLVYSTITEANLATASSMYMVLARVA